jgi:hypothetical protein
MEATWEESEVISAATMVALGVTMESKKVRPRHSLSRLNRKLNTLLTITKYAKYINILSIAVATD